MGAHCFTANHAFFCPQRVGNRSGSDNQYMFRRLACPGGSRFFMDGPRKSMAKGTAGAAEEMLAQSGVVLLRWRAEDGWPIELAMPSLETLGYAPGDPVSGTVSYVRLIHPEDRPRVEGEIDKLARSSSGVAIQKVRLVLPTGAVRWIEQRVSLRRDTMGRVTHFNGVLVDLPCRGEVEDGDQGLSAHAILESIPLPVFFKDHDLFYRGCNRAFERMLGRTHAEVIGADVYALSPAHLARQYDTMDRALLSSRGVQTYEAQVRYGDGTLHDVIFHKATFPGDAGEVRGILGVVLDVSERNQALAALNEAREQLEARVRQRTEELSLANVALEREIAERRAAHNRLRESEGKYRSIVETALEGIWVLDANAKTAFVNTRMAQMLGFGGEEMLGRPVTDFMFEEDAPDHLRRMALRRKGISEYYERRFRRKDGSTLWTLASAGVVFDSENRFQGAFAMFTDITGLKQTEDALREADRNKDELLATLSHELRNPLAPIRNSLYVLERSGANSDRARRARAVIERQVNHITHMVNDLLDINRISRKVIGLHREPLDLGEIVTQTLEDHRSLFEGRDILLDLERPKGRLGVNVDRTRIAQILGNLLQNAAKFTGLSQGLAGRIDGCRERPRYRRGHNAAGQVAAVPALRAGGSDLGAKRRRARARARAGQRARRAPRWTSQRPQRRARSRFGVSV